MSTRNVGRGTNALASSIVLACRLRDSEPLGFSQMPCGSRFRRIPGFRLATAKTMRRGD